MRTGKVVATEPARAGRSGINQATKTTGDQRRTARVAGTSSASPSSVSRPENTSPAEYPLAPNTAKCRSPCCGPGPSWNVVVRMDRAAGAVKAAASPLMKRLAMSSAAVVDEPAEQRGRREDGRRRGRPAPAEQVGGAPAEQQQPAVAQDVAADDPLQGVGGQPELGLDGGRATPTIDTSRRVETR